MFSPSKKSALRKEDFPAFTCPTMPIWRVSPSSMSFVPASTNSCISRSMLSRWLSMNSYLWVRNNSTCSLARSNRCVSCSLVMAYTNACWAHCVKLLWLRRSWMLCVCPLGKRAGMVHSMLLCCKSISQMCLEPTCMAVCKALYPRLSSPAQSALWSKKNFTIATFPWCTA